MAETRYKIRCLDTLPAYDIDALYERLNELGELKVEINTWPDVIFTSNVDFFEMENLLNSLTGEKEGPILSWNTEPPMKRKFRKIVSEIKKRVFGITKG